MGKELVKEQEQVVESLLDLVDNGKVEIGWEQPLHKILKNKLQQELLAKMSEHNQSNMSNTSIVLMLVSMRCDCHIHMLNKLSHKHCLMAKSKISEVDNILQKMWKLQQLKQSTTGLQLCQHGVLQLLEAMADHSQMHLARAT